MLIKKKAFFQTLLVTLWPFKLKQWMPSFVTVCMLQAFQAKSETPSSHSLIVACWNIQELSQEKQKN